MITHNIVFYEVKYSQFRKIIPKYTNKTKLYTLLYKTKNFPKIAFKEVIIFNIVFVPKTGVVQQLPM